MKTSEIECTWFLIEWIHVTNMLDINVNRMLCQISKRYELFTDSIVSCNFVVGFELSVDPHWEHSGYNVQVHWHYIGYSLVPMAL